MQCSLSGEVPTEPVVSLKSGHVFEKSLIEKYIEQTGQCPVTKQELSKGDLLAIKSTTSSSTSHNSNVSRPRVPSMTSIPQVLQVLQTEWDSVMLECFTLKQHLQTTREELARVMYQHDAACRVIARLMTERDQARAALLEVEKHGSRASSNANSNANANADHKNMDVEESNVGFNENILSKLDHTSKQLSANRKKAVKDASAKVATPAAISSYTQQSTHSLHSPSTPGVLCLDTTATRDHLIVTGGADSNVVLFNRSSGKIEDTLKGHKKKITSVKCHVQDENIIYSTSHDTTACIWRRSTDGFEAVATLREHKGAVVGCSVHPSGDYLVTASTDGSWNFYDSRRSQLYQSVTDDSSSSSAYTCVEFHPDGLILGAGTSDNIIKIFDVKQQKNVHSFAEGHAKGVTSLSFSENGYYLASSDNNGTIKLWDLRKLADFHTITVENNASVNTVKFDASGSYLAVGADDVRVYRTKPWELVSTYNDHRAAVTGVVFGADAQYIASTSQDRSLKIFTASS